MTAIYLGIGIPLLVAAFVFAGLAVSGRWRTRVALGVAATCALGVGGTVVAAFVGPVNVRTVDREVEVEKKVYVLSSDGKTTTSEDVDTSGVKGEDVQTGYKVISDWTNKQTEHDWGDGFSVVEVDGQRCILWVRNARGYQGEETGSGMSCRPATAR